MSRVDPLALAARIGSGERAALARGITLCESTRADDDADAAALLQALPAEARLAVRVGITGPPGVGKSTFIERLGLDLLARGHRVAVLAVDPSSRRSGGSILGDKTRMPQLALADGAYVRPSPSGGSLGGVHEATREAIVLCEAAGYDVILVETVGVGQSETAVADMVDTFCVLVQPGSGDELQGVKKGVLELAEVLVVHKADGERLAMARTAARDLKAAVRLFGAGAHETGLPAAARPAVVLASAVTGDGVAEAWDAIVAHRDALAAAGRLSARRAQQRVDWLWALVDAAAVARVRGGLAEPACRVDVAALEGDVRDGTVPVRVAAGRLLAAV